MAVTVGAAGYSSAKPGQYDPSWGVPCPNRLWGTTGNTDVVIDASVHTGNCVIITPTTATAGRLYVSSVGNGTFTVTSSSSETATTTAYNYFICGN